MSRALPRELSDQLQGGDILTPYGVEVRYPSDAPELLSGEELAALAIARRVRDSVLAALGPHPKAG